VRQIPLCRGILRGRRQRCGQSGPETRTVEIEHGWHRTRSAGVNRGDREDYDCGIVPVVNERGEAIGAMTDRDVCLALGTRDVPASILAPRNVMTQPVIGRAPEDDCVEVLLTMRENHVRRLQVLGIGGVLVGIVPIDNLVRWAARAPAIYPLRVVILAVLADVDMRARPMRKIVGGA
jgi:CBS domain-containing protein